MSMDWCVEEGESIRDRKNNIHIYANLEELCIWNSLNKLLCMVSGGGGEQGLRSGDEMDQIIEEPWKINLKSFCFLLRTMASHWKVLNKGMTLAVVVYVGLEEENQRQAQW